MTAVLKKPVQINPIQQALEDYTILQNENEVLRLSETQLKDMNVGLLQENKILHERLREVEAERDTLKNYAYELVARLDVIVETITSAKAHSRKMALHKEPDVEKSETTIEHNDGIENEVRDLVAETTRIPINRFPKKV
ncbi:MAG: hypothetical protein NVSMB28_21310 [Collimonas sp.]